MNGFFDYVRRFTSSRILARVFNYSVITLFPCCYFYGLFNDAISRSEFLTLNRNHNEAVKHPGIYVEGLEEGGYKIAHSR